MAAWVWTGFFLLSQATLQLCSPVSLSRWPVAVVWTAFVCGGRVVWRPR